MSREFQGPTEDAMLRVAERHPGTIVILPRLSMCESGVCLWNVNGDSIYRDGSHIRRNLPEDTKWQLGEIMGLGRIFTAR